ncbi:MAG: protein-disulfide reductase DsbD domain-containing protein [Terracidiphilus sp.]
MNQIKIGCCAAAMFLVSFATIPAPAQSDDPGRSILRGAAVEYLYPEQVTIPVGKPSPVEMHFRVGEGLHVNSHTPSQDFLIPTTLSIPEASGVRLEGATYPAGSDITLPLDPETKLSVYTGEFTINTRIVATRGNHLVEAKLHYQACDKNACLPPKTITVPIDVIGK